MNVLIGLGSFILGNITGVALVCLLMAHKENNFDDFNKYWNDDWN